MGFKRVLAASIALALVLIGVAAWFAYNHQAALGRSRDLVDHTHEVIEQNQQLFTLVEDAETGERGFLLTRDASYLRPYLEATAALPHARDRLKALVRDNPGQAEHVGKLVQAIDERVAFLDARVRQGLAGDFDGSVSSVRDGRGPLAMSRIRQISGEISSTERILLASRLRAAESAENLNLGLGLLVAVLALVGLVSLVFVIGGTSRRLERSLAETNEARAALEAADALKEAIFANIPDYLIVLEARGDGFVLAELNPAFETAMRVSAERVRGRTLEDLLPAAAAQQLTQYYRRVRLSDRPVISRNLFKNLPNGPRTWESILASVRSAEGAPDRIVCSIRDITERVAAEEQLRSAQRMEAVGQLTGGVAHDFNNLLQVIRGNLEMLEPLLASSEPGQRRLKGALHGVDRAAQLTRQLLAFARRQPLEPAVINLARLFGDMTDLLRRTLGEDIEVETVVAGGLWNTVADPAQVESAILNLAINARDAMPEGGRLTIELTNAVLDEAYVREAEGVEPGQYVLIAVSDNGLGMTEEVRARVFEPFFTTKAEGRGTGLGLSMVYGFVRQSHGHVQVYSEPGQGTTVKIYLPRSHQEEPARETPLAAADRGDRQVVLVVEDEPAVRAAAIAMLEELGYRCREAADAEAALAALRDDPAVDLIFSDVVMPGPLKTREFAAQARALAPQAPLLFTSGYTDNAIVHHGRLDPGVSLLSKPYAKADLARKVAQLLAARDVTDAAASSTTDRADDVSPA